MGNAEFTRPRAKANYINAFADSYDAVLVPGKRPIRLGTLIEQYRADGPRRLAQLRRCNSADCAGDLQNWAEPFDPEQSNSRLARRQAG